MSLKTKITDLAHNGSGFSKNESGKATFIPYTITGEKVLYDIVKENKKFVLGNALDILKKSHSRVNPKCKYFKKCGGCSLQHIEINKQRELKVNILKQTLSKQFKIIPENGFELIGKNLPDYAYRNRIKLSVSRDGRIGFLKPSSKEVVEIDSCKIIEPELDKVVTTLSQFIFPKEAREILIQKTKNEIEILVNKLSKKNFEKLKNAFPEFKFKKESLISSFSQVNSFANKELKNKVLDLITESKITELYAGSGNFSIELGKKGVKVTAIELDENLVEAGNKKAKDLNLKEVSFITSKAEDYILSNQICETLLLDPPRGGAFEVVKNLNPNKINKIIYVSCKPSTLGRDLEALKSKGYKIIKIYALDMFPQTTHLECVCEIEI